MIEIRSGIIDLNKKKSFITVIIVTLIGNLALAVGKGWIASITGSAALYSDAANSISDVFYSILVAIGLYIAMQPPDSYHHCHKGCQPEVLQVQGRVLYSII